jgi:hypothetical protein
MPPIGPSPTNTLDVLLHQNPTIAANSCAMVARVTIPRRPRHRPAPALRAGVRLCAGGEILFELEGEEPYPVKAGEAFWEPGFDVVHYQAANLRTDIASKFVVFILCAPDVPMMTFLDEEEIAAREHLRHQSSERHT